MRPDPWRGWVYQGLSGGKVLSRRETMHDWRRNERNSEASDCTRVAERLISASLRWSDGRLARPAGPGSPGFATANFFVDHKNLLDNLYCVTYSVCRTLYVTE